MPPHHARPLPIIPDAENAPLSCSNGRHRPRSLSNQEKVSNLVRLNNTLIKEVSSLRNKQLEISAEIKKLEELVHVGRSCNDALVVERDCLIEERRRLELEVVSLKEEAGGFSVETAALQAEIKAVHAENCELKSALSDSTVRQREIMDDLEKERKAATSAQDVFHAVNSEVERLRLDKEKCTAENSLLKSLNAGFQMEIAQLHSKEEALLEEAERQRLSNMKRVDENNALIAENHYLKSENNGFRSKISLLQSKGEALDQEIERLRLQNEKLMEEKRTLVEKSNASDAHFQSKLAQLQSKEEGLVEEVERLRLQNKNLVEEKRDLFEKNNASDAHFQSQLTQLKSKEEGLVKEVERFRLQNEKLIEEKSDLLEKKSASDAHFLSKLAEMQSKEIVLVEEVERLRLQNKKLIEEKRASLEKNKASDAHFLSKLAQLQSKQEGIVEEVERLRVQNEKLVEENKASDALFSSKLTQLQSKEGGLVEEVERLRFQNQNLIEEKHALCEKKDACDAHFESKLAQLQSKVEELVEESEQSHLHNNKLIKENNALIGQQNASTLAIIDFEIKVTQLKSMKEALLEELASLRNSVVAAHVQTAEYNKIVETLQVEVSNQIEESSKLRREKDEALQQVAMLETECAASKEKQSELESQLLHLKNNLLAILNGHESSLPNLQESKEEEVSVITMVEAVCAKSKVLEKLFESVQSCASVMEVYAIKVERSISSLQRQFSSLVDENNSVEDSKNSGIGQAASLESKVETCKVIEEIKHPFKCAKDEFSPKDKRLGTNLHCMAFFLEEKFKLGRVALPVLIVSTSTLVFAGILSYLQALQDN